MQVTESGKLWNVEGGQISRKFDGHETFPLTRLSCNLLKLRETPKVKWYRSMEVTHMW